MQRPGPHARPGSGALVAGLLLLGGGALSHWQGRRDLPMPPSPATDPARPSATATAPGFELPVRSQLDASTLPRLLARLEQADRAWLPRVELLPDGARRYVYKRRAGDPPLSLDQVKQLLRHPPRFEREQQAIRSLLSRLEQSGAVVVLDHPIRRGAAGEWNPRRGELRIRPDVPAKGSQEFARVLNHESIHVAQSCRGGSLHAQPRPLGLPRNLDATARKHLAEPLYAQVSARERRLEEEAYGSQDQLNLGPQLLAVHCPPG